MSRDIYGRTRDGDFGLPYQLDMLDRFNLQAVFFVESLFAHVIGRKTLREIVELIQDRGQEVQLHVHPEWLAWMTESILPGRTGENLKDFSQGEQMLLIQHGLRNLTECAGRKPCAFRAGSYGANFDTLAALSAIGIPYDTSYNIGYLGSDCDLQTPELLLQPQWINGIHEFPISFFCDWPAHYRPAQLCACSSEELQDALLSAWRLGWVFFVIVWHSFELIKNRRRATTPPRADRIVIKRFESLCRFLSNNREKFQTTGFSDIAPAEIRPAVSVQPLTGRIHHTAQRFVEQVARRFF